MLKFFIGAFILISATDARAVSYFTGFELKRKLELRDLPIALISKDPQTGALSASNPGAPALGPRVPRARDTLIDTVPTESLARKTFRLRGEVLNFSIKASDPSVPKLFIDSLRLKEIEVMEWSGGNYSIFVGNCGIFFSELFRFQYDNPEELQFFWVHWVQLTQILQARGHGAEQLSEIGYRLNVPSNDESELSRAVKTDNLEMLELIAQSYIKLENFDTAINYIIEAFRILTPHKSYLHNLSTSGERRSLGQRIKYWSPKHEWVLRNYGFFAEKGNSLINAVRDAGFISRVSLVDPIPSKETFSALTQFFSENLSTKRLTLWSREKGRRAGPIDEKYAYFLAKLLEINVALEKLQIYNQGITDQSLIMMLDGLQKNKRSKLEVLDLHSNLITQQGKVLIKEFMDSSVAKRLAIKKILY